jgi:hypothetical protein
MGRWRLSDVGFRVNTEHAEGVVGTGDNSREATFKVPSAEGKVMASAFTTRMTRGGFRPRSLYFFLFGKCAGVVENHQQCNGAHTGIAVRLPIKITEMTAAVSAKESG